MLSGSDSTAPTPAASIPAELRALPHWVAWRRETRDGKPTKVPYGPTTRRKASSTDPATWATFDDALRFAERTRAGGIGFVFTADVPYAGIDLDGCIDDTGTLALWAQTIVGELASYTELSPSGRGLHVIVRGKPPANGKRGAIEMYGDGRYFTVSGDHLDGTPTTIAERTAELAALHARVFTPKPTPNGKPPPTASADLDADGELVAKARGAANGVKFAALYDGDWKGAGYPSQSEADLALCQMLAFWTGKDAARIDALFRQSGLMRAKWDERHGSLTYGDQTIERAITNTGETYTPHGKARVSPPAPHGEMSGERPLTDYGNAERLVDAHGEDLCFCFAWERWLVWDGPRWRVDETGEAERRAKRTVRDIYHEAAEQPDAASAKATAQWAMKSESKQRLAAMLELAQSELGIPVRPADLDADPWLLNCENGTLDLRTSELRPHRRADLLTKMTRAAYDPDADAPTFKRFIERILPDPAVRRYVQRWAGSALAGVVREHRLPVWWGSGGNGKTTLVGALLGVLGDYARQSAPELLVANDHGEHPTALADLFGARLVATVEVGEGKRLAETLVKQLSGGDRMKARYMRQDYFEWEPTHKIALVCNHRPRIAGTDEGIWRRIDLVPFTVTIPTDEQDTELPSKLRAEYPGILRWLVEGCLSWQRDGLERPEAVRAANEAYRTEQDSLGDFLTERCIVKPSTSVSVAEFYASYTLWCEANHERPLAKRTLTQRLRERGVVDGRQGHTRSRCYLGIGLLAPTPDDCAMRTDADSSSVSPHENRTRLNYAEHLSASVRTPDAPDDALDAPPTEPPDPASSDEVAPDGERSLPPNLVGALARWPNGAEGLVAELHQSSIDGRWWATPTAGRAVLVDELVVIVPAPPDDTDAPPASDADHDAEEVTTWTN